MTRRRRTSWTVHNAALRLIHVLIHCICLWCAAADDQHGNQLSVTLYRVMPTSAEIDWSVDDVHQQGTVAIDLIASCELVFGPVDHPDEVQVLSNAIVPADRQQIELFDLQRNVTYHFHMVCYDNRLQTKLISNKLVFTTGVKAAKSYGINYVPFDGSQWTNESTSGLELTRPFPVSTDTIQQRPLPDVILGAIFGFIGFLIITVTVVIIVRRYSYWRMRHRRMYDQEEDVNNRDAFPDA